MPTRKQRRRELKAKRHEYETVWLDSDGNELEDPPPEAVELAEKKKEKPAAKGAPAKQQGRGRREPQPPSWNRAMKRGLLLGGVVFAMFGLTSKGKYVAVLPLAVLYTILFIPFTYYIDRFAYKRYQARTAAGTNGATPRPAKKR
jgi:hypothetical protein